MAHRCLFPIVVALWLGAATPVPAGAGPRGNAALLRTLPPLARQTVQAQTAHGRVDSVTRTNRDGGEVVYEIEFTRAGRTRDFSVASNGKLVDIEVFLNELPRVVQGAVHHQTLTFKPDGGVAP